jgi:superfamily II DNA or RNA helicase
MLTKARRHVEKKTKGFDEFVANAKMLLADEVHELCSEIRISGLTATNPEIAFGLTGTWLKRMDKRDRILGDFFNLGGFKDTLCTVSHTEVQESGRVVETEIHSHVFPKHSYPEINPDGFKGFSELEALTVYHTGRNKFLSELCIYLMEENKNTQRGCIMAFTPTIKHAQLVCRMLAKKLNISPTPRELEQQGIAVYNAAMPDGEKNAIRTKVAEGKILLTITTDSLSTGIDIPRIYDVIDLSGQLKTNVTLQRSGRTVRIFAEGKIARMHIIFDDQSGLLLGISRKKQNVLEEYYQKRAIMHPTPVWKTTPKKDQTTLTFK